jgi:hypothetical protein
MTTPRESTDMSIWTRLERLEPTSLIVVGFVLFVIPEPATSTVGIGMMLLGIAWWVSWWE